MALDDLRGRRKLSLARWLPSVIAVVIAVVGGFLLARFLAHRILTPSVTDDGCGVYPMHIVGGPAASAGSVITVRTRGYDCSNPPVVDGGTEHLVLVRHWAGPGIAEADVSVDERGGFTATLSIPKTAPPGSAIIVASGPTYPHCAGGAGSCMAFAASITLRG